MNQTLKKELLAQLQHLRTETREISRLYVANLQRDIVQIIEFLNETPEQVTQTISKYRQLLRGEISGTELWRELRLMNQLGVTRGQMAGQRS